MLSIAVLLFFTRRKQKSIEEEELRRSTGFNTKKKTFKTIKFELFKGLLISWFIILSSFLFYLCKSNTFIDMYKVNSDCRFEYINTKYKLLTAFTNFLCGIATKTFISGLVLIQICEWLTGYYIVKEAAENGGKYSKNDDLDEWKHSNVTRNMAIVWVSLIILVFLSRMLYKESYHTFSAVLRILTIVSLFLSFCIFIRQLNRTKKEIHERN